jgi:hypothetical protein
MLVLISTNALGGDFYIEREREQNDLASSYSIGFGIKDKIGETFEVDGSYAYGEADGEVTKDLGKLTLNWDPEIDEMNSFWVFDELGWDKSRNVDIENSLGFGLKRYLVKKKIGEGEDAYYKKLSLSFGILYAFKSVTDPVTKQTTNSEDSKYSARIRGSGKIINLTIFYQPYTEDTDEYDLKGYLDLKIGKIYDHITLKWYYAYEYWSITDSIVISEGIRAEINY